LHHEAQDFSDHALEKRSTLHVLLDLGNDVLHLYVVHFGLLAAGRARQLNRLMDWIETATPSHAPLLVAGDFNDWQLRLSPDLWTRLRLREAVPQGRGRPLRTFPSIMPIASMDRIFYRGFELASLRRAPAGPRWARLSDHLPLIAGLHRADSKSST
jgi:endonuclease/exonuclease/phosphatase family metal-dependent hydrolase